MGTVSQGCCNVGNSHLTHSVSCSGHGNVTTTCPKLAPEPGTHPQKGWDYPWSGTGDVSITGTKEIGIFIWICATLLSDFQFLCFLFAAVKHREALNSYFCGKIAVNNIN